MEPELILTESQIDYDIAAMCGETPADFLVMTFDGKPFHPFGTPMDGPRARRGFRNNVVALNERSRESLWTDFRAAWSPQIEEAFGISGVELERFRPEVSYEVHRVVAARSKHLHAAIGLFERMAERIHAWGVGMGAEDGYWVQMVTRPPWKCSFQMGKDLPLAICKAMLQAFGGDVGAVKGGAE